MKNWEKAVDVDDMKGEDGFNSVFIAIKENNLEILK